MELMLDSANIEKLSKLAQIYPYVGVTSNPSIIKEEGKINFFEHFNKIREIIKSNSLHIQVVSVTCDEIVAEARKIVENIDENVYIKIPVTNEGLKAIKILKAQGYKITATAIYTKWQGLLAIANNVDYIAPYFNRIQNLGVDPCDVISCFRKDIDQSKANTKILAASFHSGEQVTRALNAGAHAVTIQPKLLETMLEADYITEAVNTFAKHWKESQNSNNILDCE